MPASVTVARIVRGRSLDGTSCWYPSVASRTALSSTNQFRLSSQLGRPSSSTSSDHASGALRLEVVDPGNLQWAVTGSAFTAGDHPLQIANPESQVHRSEERLVAVCLQVARSHVQHFGEGS